MKLTFTGASSKDLDKITDSKLKAKVLSILAQLETAPSLATVSQLKKLKGSKNAYRIRLGDFRIGFFLMDNDFLTLARFVHRKDISKAFP